MGSAPDGEQLPNIGEALAPVLLRIPRQRQPLLIAFAERLAASRYREWALEYAGGQCAAQLRACAEREEQIAERIEALFPDAAAGQRALLAAHPELEDINRTLFAGRPLLQQFRIQAGGERLGAATWRSFAKHEHDAARQAAFAACAGLEEDSALVLEAILAEAG